MSVKKKIMCYKTSKYIQLSLNLIDSYFNLLFKFAKYGPQSQINKDYDNNKNLENKIKT